MVNQYTKRRVSTLLLAGDCKSDVEGITRFYSYLVDEAGYNPSKINYVIAKRRQKKSQDITDTIVRFFLNVGKDNDTALFVYSGHGGEYSMFPTPRDEIAYDDLVEVMRQSPFFFINDCCSAGSAIEVFESYGLLRKHGSVIAATNSSTDIYSNVLLDALLHSYRSKRPFQRRVLHSPHTVERQKPVRRGIVLDHLLYPVERIARL